MPKIFQALFASTLLFLSIAAADAQQDDDLQSNPAAAAFQAAIEAASIGPAPIPLINQAVLHLPVNNLFIPKAEAAEFMEQIGNYTDDSLLGIIMPADDEHDWMVIATYEKSGYIKEDDAKDWNANELLSALKEATESQNEQRRAQGIPEFVVSRWVQPPTYDTATHRLVWSAELRDKHPEPGSETGVNYNTYALGREGYISLNLVTNIDAIEADKPAALALLNNLQFNAGKRYEEFDASTDRLATYGLAALVGGIAAKKLGLFAVIAAFAAKFIKIIALAAVAGLAGLKKFFSSRKQQDQ
ncbi:MAG: DUF2167 domain-containing protein [Pseudomonadales bacterium]|jgi:uncharacterized membrane-anchored protein|nr:DUF2167 domain-containing protein [Pseudomonadales bacterium]